MLRREIFFLRNQAYDDLDDILLKLNSIAPEDERTLTLAGKFYYAIDNKELALVKFEDLCKAKTKDATVWYLYATLLSPTEKRCRPQGFSESRIIGSRLRTISVQTGGGSFFARKAVRKTA
ncbi:hypothetical protein [Treponema phagedenis]|uniref:hypothetical protein n=1 Tax=Treponema phagedenis TaxID=162 RepID=UPI0011EF590F|nr:hypothetical protein [Treponema phagedenis]TYT76500.1 hypothetical protein FS559_13570 [Treponema phagedenis]